MPTDTLETLCNLYGLTLPTPHDPAPGQVAIATLRRRRFVFQMWRDERLAPEINHHSRPKA